MFTKSPRLTRLFAAFCLVASLAWVPESADAALRSGPQRRHQRRVIRRVIDRRTAIDQVQYQNVAGVQTTSFVG